MTKEINIISNWFQTDAAYEFFASLPELFIPFRVETPHARCIGYLTNENLHNGVRHQCVKNAIKQFLTCRAIIIGGPELREGCTPEEVTELMKAVVSKCKAMGAIYIETRNFNDYSQWRSGFEAAGFTYEPHNNFHIPTKSFAGDIGYRIQDTGEIDYTKVVNGLMGKGRIRDIKTSFRDGAVVIDHPTIEQVREYYQILKHLYTTKVKTPLFPLSFFEALYNHPDGRFILVALNGEIIGGTVCVEQEGRCLYEWFVAGRDGEWKSIFPSSVATYAGIRYAAEHNLPRFDMMGAGTPQEAYGVRDFKARFGGELVEHGRYKYICKPLLYKLGELGVAILKKLK